MELVVLREEQILAGGGGYKNKVIRISVNTSEPTRNGNNYINKNFVIYSPCSNFVYYGSSRRKYGSNLYSGTE
jgi:hypothetical protein